MDKDRVAESAKKIKGSIKEVVGKAAGDAKLEAKGKADKVEGQGSERRRPQRHLQINSLDEVEGNQPAKNVARQGRNDRGPFLRPGTQGVSQSASPTSQTRPAKPSRSRRCSDGSHVTETALISDVVPSAAPQRRTRQRYGDSCRRHQARRGFSLALGPEVPCPAHAQQNHVGRKSAAIEAGHGGKPRRSADDLTVCDQRLNRARSNTVAEHGNGAIAKH
jgi:uncharacterized protein YjbJ (UPF0337 family)